MYESEQLCREGRDLGECVRLSVINNGLLSSR